jgi:hypothetical protein
VPLGLFAFVVIMAATFALLREGPVPAAARVTPVSSSYAMTAFVALAILLRPMLTPAEAATLPLPAAPMIAGAVPQPLDDKERALFSERQARAFKLSLTHEGRRAAVVIVVSDSFRAHHAPEVCARAHGKTVERLRSERVLPDLEAHTYLIDGGTQRGVYWFESAGATTDSLLDRTLARRGERWALVSLIIAGDALPSPKLLEALRAAVHPLVQQPGEPHGTEKR